MFSTEAVECGKIFCGKVFLYFLFTTPVEKFCKVYKAVVDKKAFVFNAFLSFPHIFSPTAIITT